MILFFVINCWCATEATEQFGFDCRFARKGSFSHVGTVYTCDALTIGNPVSAFLNFVNGTHLLNRTDHHVQRLYMLNQNLPFIPINLSRFFPNLVSMHIENSGLHQITSMDFQPFPNLRALSFDRNLILDIDDDTFDHNQNLRWLGVPKNSIRSVGLNTFKNLPELVTLEMLGNVCIDKTEKDRDAVVQLISDLATACKP